MDDQDKPIEQLLAELAASRQRVAVLERAEAALRESEERFRKVFEEGPIGVVLVGTDGNIQRCNRRFCEMLGYSEDEIVARGLASISDPDDWQRDYPFVSRLWHGEIAYYRVEKRYRRKDGRALWTQLTVSLMHDAAGRPVNNIGMVEDITERKRAEEALRKAHDDLEEKVKERTAELSKANEDLVILHRFADAAGQGFGIASPDGQIAYVNPFMCRLLGEERPEEVVGKHLARYFSEQHMQWREREMLPVLMRTDRWQGEIAISRQGEALALLQNSFLIREEDGTPAYLATVLTDITERKKAQEALQREHRTLRHLLQSSDHERQLIAYDIHDGLAQYLTGAIMQFQVRDQLEETKPEEAAKAYDAGITMLRQAQFEARRLISGVRPPILDEAGVVAAISHLVNEHKQQQGPKIAFRSSIEFDRLVPILENAVYRITQEALANACRHSKSTDVLVRLVQHGEQLRIEVRDRGVGFNPDDIGEGRFGLAGIRERARLLGGTAMIESKLRKGTRVVVELPIVLQKDQQ